MRKLLLSLPVVLAAALAACDSAPSAQKAGAPPPPPVTVAKPVVKDVMEWDEFTGRFEATSSVEVRARVGGYLDSVHFKDGSLVKQGDLLFVIDRRPFQAAYNQAEASATAARTRLEFARSELDRVERLLKGGAAAERTLDERRQLFQTAQADVNGTRAALEKARLDLGFTEIRSPIAGRISRKLVSEGNLVAANETLLTTIVSQDPIYFYFDVDERSYLGYVRMRISGERPSSREGGQEVRLTLSDEREASRTGVLDFVDNRIDAASGTMRGRAVFENKENLLTPGMFGRVRIPGSGTYKGILIPDEAISADLDRRLVYVVAADGGVTPRIVRPGPRIDGYRVIRQGLAGDETIVISGLQRLRFSPKVTPKLETLPPVRQAQR